MDVDGVVQDVAQSGVRRHIRRAKRFRDSGVAAQCTTSGQDKRRQGDYFLPPPRSDQENEDQPLRPLFFICHEAIRADLTSNTSQTRLQPAISPSKARGNAFTGNATDGDSSLESGLTTGTETAEQSSILMEDKKFS